MFNDFRFAARTFLKTPVFFLTAVVALAVGIGANSSIFSLANAILFRPLPYPQSERIVMVWDSNVQRTWDTAPAAFGNFSDWRRHQTTFEWLAASRSAAFHLTGGEEPERAPGGLVTEGFFRVFGVQPAWGRDFQPQEFTPGNERVVILSHGIWMRRFGGNPAVLGSPIRINDVDYLIVGIMPAGFETPAKHQIWAPLALNAQAAANRDRHIYLVYGRLRPGVSVVQAGAELAGLARQAEAAYPDTNAGFSVVVRSLSEEVVGALRPALFVLFGATAALLLVACANVANLQLARAAARGKEIAVRCALGASGWRIIRQMLAESLTLAAVGGAAGLLLAYWAVRLVVSLPVAASVPRLQEAGLDPRVAVFTLAVSAATGVLFGMAPALYAVRLNLNDVLKQGGRSGSGGGQKARNILVVAEIALAVVLLSVAGLLGRSFLALTAVNPGFQPEGVLLMETSLPRGRYTDPARQEQTYRRVLERVAQLPGVQVAAGATTVPFGKADIVFTYYAAGQVKPPPQEMPAANYYGIAPEYFRALRIPLKRGRPFTERDGEGEPRVAIVNETLARKLWPDRDPVGQFLIVEHSDPAPRQVVGVVGDIKHYGLDKEPSAEIYEPLRQRPYPLLTLTLRSEMPPESLSRAVARAAREIEPDLAIYNVRTMEKQIHESVLARRLSVTMALGFALMALLIAAIGVYGVLSYSVARRTQEMGVRMALGAGPAQILSLVLVQGLKLAAAGAAAGVAVSLLAGKVLASQLYGVSPSDPVTILAVVAVLLVTAAAACLAPAARAARVEPTVALRYE